MTAAPSWVSTAHPETEPHLTKRVAAVMTQVAAESKDTHARIYTQAEVVRAIELATEAPLAVLRKLRRGDLHQRVRHLYEEAQAAINGSAS